MRRVSSLTRNGRSSAILARGWRGDQTPITSGHFRCALPSLRSSPFSASRAMGPTPPRHRRAADPAANSKDPSASTSTHPSPSTSALEPYSPPPLASFDCSEARGHHRRHDQPVKSLTRTAARRSCRWRSSPGGPRLVDRRRLFSGPSRDLPRYPTRWPRVYRVRPVQVDRIGEPSLLINESYRRRVARPATRPRSQARPGAARAPVAPSSSRFSKRTRQTGCFLLSRRPPLRRSSAPAAALGPSTPAAR